MPYLIELDHKTALTLIAADGCSNFHGMEMGACLKQGNRRVVSTFGAERACDPCIAYAALYPQHNDVVETNPCVQPHLVDNDLGV